MKGTTTRRMSLVQTHGVGGLGAGGDEVAPSGADAAGWEAAGFDLHCVGGCVAPGALLEHFDYDRAAPTPLKAIVWGPGM